MIQNKSSKVVHIPEAHVYYLDRSISHHGPCSLLQQSRHVWHVIRSRRISEIKGNATCGISFFLYLSYKLYWLVDFMAVCHLHWCSYTAGTSIYDLTDTSHVYRTLEAHGDGERR